MARPGGFVEKLPFQCRAECDPQWGPGVGSFTGRRGRELWREQGGRM